MAKNTVSLYRDVYVVNIWIDYICGFKIIRPAIKLSLQYQLLKIIVPSTPGLKIMGQIPYYIKENKYVETNKKEYKF